jgi:uncharacterized protein (TIGR02284 family)
MIAAVSARPQVNHFDADACLAALIDTCDEAAAVQVRCAGGAERMDLQLLLTQRAAAWRRWAGELRALRNSGGTPRVSPPHRGSADAASPNDGDQALLEACERLESIALQRYRDALDEEVPRVVRAVLLRHVEGIRNSRAQMRWLHVGAAQAQA